MKLRQKAELKALLAAPAKGIGAKKKQKEDAAALEAKHAEQVKEFDRREKEEAEREAAGEAGGATGEEAASNDADAPESAPAAAAAAAPSAKQPSRAQKKKAAKADKEKNRAAELREMTKDMVDARGVEDAAIAQHLAKDTTQRLRVREMVSDGHCLYRAVADQAERQQVDPALVSDAASAFLALRRLTASYIDAHRGDFEAFMIVEDENGRALDLTESTWKKYLADLVNEELAVWGGHTEVVALSKALRRPIVIWSADGRMEVGEEFRNQDNAVAPLHISFHQHYYGLGSHYNSVVVDEEADAAEKFAAGESDEEDQ